MAPEKDSKGNGNGRKATAPVRSRAVITGAPTASPASPPVEPEVRELSRAATTVIEDAPITQVSLEAPAAAMPAPKATREKPVSDLFDDDELAAAAERKPKPVPELPEGAGRIQKYLHELRPSVVTGGVSMTPLLLIGLLNVVDGFDTNVYNVLLPEIRDYFGVSLSVIALFTTLTGLLSFALAVPVGYLSDRVNRLWLIVVGATVWASMAVLTGFAWSFTMLVAFRFGAGLGKILAPSQQNLLSDYYPPNVRAGIFSFHAMAGRIGQFIGPVIAGTLASLFFWQVPFLVVGIPSLAIAFVIITKLREPVRGEQERRQMGASEEAALTAEAPPSWTESWRIAKGVRSLRRIWMALPFLIGAQLVIGTIMPLFYDEVFGLGPSARGVIGAFDEPLAIGGLFVGGIAANRLLRYRPGRVIAYLGLVSVTSAAIYALMAISPYVWMVIGLSYTRAFLGAILTPALGALTAMVIPARARGFALSATVLFAAPGFLFLLLFGLIGDSFGLRAGLLIMVPMYLIGGLIITSAGSSVEGDIRAAQAAAMAAAVSRDSKKAGKAKLLVCRDVDVHYDQVQVLFNVDFEVEEGEIIALLGTNGAGKSTLLRAISGTAPASNGAIFFDGEDITFMPPSAHAARGIIQVPGGKGVFPGLTVAENLKLAAWIYRSDTEYVRTGTEAVLDRFPVLRDRLGQVAGNLSGGEQQMLTLGQAFLSRPRLLMIDELSLGLAPTIVEQLLVVVRAIAESGTTIILVEQSVNVALTVAKRAVFMEKGEIRFTGSTEELLQRPDILRSVYLKGAGGGGGAPISGYGSRSRRGVEELATAPGVALEVRDVTKRYGGIAAIPGIDLTLEEGKILGLIGPNGAGKTTLFDIISGFVTPDAGRVLLFGEDITDLAPDQRARLGLARSFQDARLFPSLTVTENLAVALERHIESKSTVSAALHLPNVTNAERKLGRRIDRLIRLMNIGDFRDKFVKELSTGSRRIVDLACVMACDPKVLLLDEPSSGIAQAEAEELGPLLHRIKWETGCSILIIEHDMPLISAVADELVALDLGQVVTRGAPQDVLEHPQVIESYLGTSEEVIQRSGQLS